jgi:hypothetical protein
MSDDFEKMLNEKLKSGFKEAESEVPLSAQSIKGNGNIQVSNSQKINQCIQGNNNIQIAGIWVDE